MHKSAFQAVKRTIMHVSVLPLSYVDKKTIYKVIGFSIQNMAWEDLRHA